MTLAQIMVVDTSDKHYNTILVSVGDERKKKFYNIGRQKFDKFEKDIEFVDMKMVNRDKFDKLFTSVNHDFLASVI